MPFGLGEAAIGAAFAALICGVEVLGSRSNPFGEWGSLAHSQTPQWWALVVALLAPIFVAVVTARWHRSAFSPDAEQLPVEGLIDGTTDGDPWIPFELASRASLERLSTTTLDTARNGTQIIVWAEGAWLVSADYYPEALAQIQTLTGNTPCVLVTSWLILNPSDGLMSNVVMTIENGEIVSTVGKQHPVPGADATHTRTVPAETSTVDTSLGRLGVAICFDADHHET